MSETNGNNLISLQDLKVHYDVGANPAHLKGLRNIINGLVVAIIAVAGIYLLSYLFAARLPEGLVLWSSYILKRALAIGVLAIIVLGAIQYFRSIKYRQVVKAVDGVSLEIKRGETLGLVGESGCGKSTLGKAILRLTEPTGGKVLFNGADLANLPQGAMREQRKCLQMIFQDPYASLNPRMTVGNIIGEPIRTFRLAGKDTVESKVQELMETVGLSRRFTKRYPHEFSGGQRQRIGIARALAVDPEFIVADEPISALDVSIQAQIMNLMERLQKGKDLTYLFISHDLRAVRHLSDRVAVMYLGKIVELAESKEIYADPLMPYTIALISAVPVPDPQIEAKRERIILKGDVPSPINPPSGCHFHTRCQYKIKECEQIVPQLVEITPRHQAACIRINAEHPHIAENAEAGLGAIGS